MYAIEAIELAEGAGPKGQVIWREVPVLSVRKCDALSGQHAAPPRRGDGDDEPLLQRKERQLQAI
jgi:hypothetical protein